MKRRRERIIKRQEIKSIRTEDEERNKNALIDHIHNGKKKKSIGRS